MPTNLDPLTDTDYIDAADIIGCSVKAIKAVSIVESGKDGAFGPDGRCVIRFECHKFVAFFGPDKLAQSHQYFDYNPQRPWMDHRAKLPGELVWSRVHTDQNREWQVFEFARSLDEVAAMKSISMGMFQIMGFNYLLTGVDTVQAFFADHCESAQAQLLAFSRFCLRYRQLAKRLKEQDWFQFATEYNGTGQAADYAARLEAAFKHIP